MSKLSSEQKRALRIGLEGGGAERRVVGRSFYTLRGIVGTTLTALVARGMLDSRIDGYSLTEAGLAAAQKP